MVYFLLQVGQFISTDPRKYLHKQQLFYYYDCITAVGINTICKEKIGKKDILFHFWEDVLEGLTVQKYFA